MEIGNWAIFLDSNGVYKIERGRVYALHCSAIPNKQGMSDCKTVSYFLTGIIFLTRAPIPYFAIIVQEQDGTTSRRRLCNSQRL